MKLIINAGGRLQALTKEQILAKAEKELIPGGKAAGRPDSDFPVQKLTEGANVEMEHTTDRKMAREITKDHLAEDANYYDKPMFAEEKKGKSMKKGELTPKKARQMLHDKQAQGHPLTEKQRGYFGAVAGGAAKKSCKAEEPDGAVRERAMEADAPQVDRLSKPDATGGIGKASDWIGSEAPKVEDMDPIDAVKADMQEASQTARMSKGFPPRAPKPPMPPGLGQKVAQPKPLNPAQPAQPGQPMPPGQPVQAAQAAQPAKPGQPQQPGQMGQPGQMPQQPGQPAHPPTPGMPPQQLPGGTAGMPQPPKPQGPPVAGMPAITPMGVHGGSKPAGASTEEAINEKFNDTREFVGKYANTPPKDHWNMIDALRQQGHDDLANAHEALMRHKTDGDLEHLHKVTNHLREHYYGNGQEHKPSGDLTGEIEDQKVPQVRGHEQQGEMGLEAEKNPQVPQNAQPHDDEMQGKSEHEGVAQPVKGSSQPGQNVHEGPGGRQEMAPKQTTKAPSPYSQGDVGGNIKPQQPGQQQKPQGFGQQQPPAKGFEFGKKPSFPPKGEPKVEGGDEGKEKKKFPFQKSMRGLKGLEDFLEKARNVTPIGGITPKGYKKVAENQYVKEEPGQGQGGKQLGMFGQESFQAKKPEAPKAPKAQESSRPPLTPQKVGNLNRLSVGELGDKPLSYLRGEQERVKRLQQENYRKVEAIPGGLQNPPKELAAEADALAQYENDLTQVVQGAFGEKPKKQLTPEGKEVGKYHLRGEPSSKPLNVENLEAFMRKQKAKGGKGPDWITSRDLTDSFGDSPRTHKKMLDVMVNRGILEVVTPPEGSAGWKDKITRYRLTEGGEPSVEAKKTSYLESQVQDLMQNSKGRVNRADAEYQVYAAAHDGHLRYPNGDRVTVEDVDAIAKESGSKGGQPPAEGNDPGAGVEVKLENLGYGGKGGVHRIHINGIKVRDELDPAKAEAAANAYKDVLREGHGKDPEFHEKRQKEINDMLQQGKMRYNPNASKLKAFAEAHGHMAQLKRRHPEIGGKSDASPFLEERVQAKVKEKYPPEPSKSTPSPEKPAAGPRPISNIASEIRKVWKNVNFAAKPYLDVMHSLETMGDQYGADDAKSIVSYFLSNASSWRGPDAKRIKQELKDLVSGRSKIKKSLTFEGISELAGYLSKDKMEASMLRKAEQPQAMPTGNADFPQTEANGGEGMEDPGTMKQVKKAGEPKADYDETYGDAPEAEEEALSDDDAEAEEQMEPHKKPIEESTEKSVTPARQRELMAKQQAVKLAKLHKSQDVVLHPYQEARMNAGLEDTIERRLNKSEPYMEDPSLVPGLPLISQGVLCKSCNHKHTAAVTACPHCGAGTTVSQVMPGVSVNGPMGIMQKSAAPVLRPAKKQSDLRFDGGVIPVKE